MFGLSNFVKDAFTTAKNLVGSISPKKPTVPQTTAPIGPQKPSGFYPQQPITPPVTNKPVAPPVSPRIAPGQFPTPDVAQSMVSQKMTDNLNVQPRSTVSASTMAPENTLSSLLQARKTLESQFLDTLKPSTMTQDLAKLRLEGAKLTEQYNKEYKALQANPEGKLSGNLEAQLRQTKEKQNEQLGYLALRESALTGAIQLDQNQQKSIIDNIKTIAGLTQSDMVGGLQKDDVTGEISGFFRNPDTGEIQQKTVGQMTPTQDLTYEKVGGQLVAIDKKTGNVIKTYGGGGDPVAFADEVDAYAQQYAATGQKPTALPEGVTFGMIAQRAADLPKSEGTVVSKSTNTSPSNVPVQYAEGIATQANLVRNTLPKMLEIYPKLITGGALNPFKTKNRIEYQSYAQAFLTDLLKAKSGQAVTEQEFNRYKELLPRGLDQLTGAGFKKLQALNDLMNNELTNKLDSKGLSIYGYSQVDVAGKKMKVGDTININGIEGRVNPNGTITPTGDFNQAGNASASNSARNIPQRNNNPGNIKQGGLADKYATGVDEQGHLIFPDADTGFQAMQEDIQAKVSGQSQWLPANPTIAQLGKVYAEDPNWSNSVARILGVSPSTPTQSVSLPALTKAIAQQEGFYA